MNTQDSINLAKLWIKLSAIKRKIDNVVIPLGSHLGIEDPDLMTALETLSARIEKHFEHFKLVAVVRKD